MTYKVFNAPRDARTPLIERLQWSTAVQISRSGAEVRNSLRDYPRHDVSFNSNLFTTDSRAALLAIKEGEIVLLPLWQHAITPERNTFDVVSKGVGFNLALTHTGLYQEQPSTLAFSWPEGFEIAAPAALARFLDTKRQLTHLNQRLTTASLSFRLLSYFEDVAPYSGPVLANNLFDFNAFSAPLITEESFEDDVNEHDTGLCDGLRETRFSKRSYAIPLTLNTRTSLLQFRQFLFAIKGRHLGFNWTPPGEVTPRVWRLSSDVVEIRYLRPSLAQCTLNVTEI